MSSLERPFVFVILFLFATIASWWAYEIQSTIDARVEVRKNLTRFDPIDAPDDTIAAARAYLSTDVVNIDPDAAYWALGKYARALRRTVLMRAGEDDAANEAAIREFSAMKLEVVEAIKRVSQ